jgi:Cytochrome c7 and related cytochrome c
MTRALAYFGFLTTALIALSSMSTLTVVRGIVSDADGPVAGAIVRWQGTNICTRTDDRGRYRLPGPQRSRSVTAARAGALIAAGSARQPNLRWQPFAHDDDEDYAWIDPAPGSRQSFNCANCHQQIYDEWSQSAHGNSAKNRKFLQLFGGSDGAAPAAPTWNLLKEYPLGSGVCAACHAPTLASPDLDYDIRKAEGVSAHGVHCDYCHKIADAPTDKLGTRFGRDGYPLARPRHGEQLFFGPLDDAVRSGESFVFAPFYKESRYCASCHEGIIFGVHVYGTYSEWLASPARQEGKQCQDCHMAPTGKMSNIAPGHGGVERDPRTLASHDFPGSSLTMLRQCLDVKAAASHDGSQVAVTVAVEPKNVGHRVPTGFIDRHVILIVEAADDTGRPALLREGPVLPTRAGAALAGRPGAIYGKQHLDAGGSPLPFWRSADELRDTRLTPEQIERRRFIFAENAATIRVRLIYRRFWESVARSRGWEDNDLGIIDLMIEPAKKE